MIPKNQCPQNCPKCDSNNLDFKDDEFSGDEYFNRILCCDCDCEWSEKYKFVDWVEIKRN